VTQMTERQLRGETFAEPLEPDCTGFHICPQCGNQLTGIECTDSCPFASDCDDYQKHESAGRFWCTTLQEVTR